MCIRDRENIVLETDCPYMAPEPFRGKECHSGMIRFTAQKVADIKQAVSYTHLDVYKRQMMDRIVHRGPDMGGMYTDDGIALGFRRLSILDLSLIHI